LILTTPAPSWSWASIDGPIVPRHFESAESLATIIDVELDLKTDNVFGQVRGAVLTISGLLFATPMPWALFDPQSYTNTHIMDGWALSFDDVMNIDDQVPEQAFFLPLLKSSDASESPNLTICGIIVTNVKIEESRDQYRRIGFAIVGEEDGHIANSGWFLEKWMAPPWTEEMMKTIHII
jgi:hypothetical protein